MLKHSSFHRVATLIQRVQIAQYRSIYMSDSKLSVTAMHMTNAIQNTQRKQPVFASIERHSDETSAGLTTKKSEIVSRGRGH